MRTVSVKHRDYRGLVEYPIYETIEQCREAFPTANILHQLRNAVAGDYIVSRNGWVVPLLTVTKIVNKYMMSGGVKRNRKTAFTNIVYQFPKQKICVRREKLDSFEFNYTPRDGKNIESTGARCRLYELSIRKIRWAQLVSEGYDPMTATSFVYPSVFNKNKLTKTLLANDKIINFIEEKNGNSRKKSFEAIGINSAYLAKEIKRILEDRTEKGILRKWAFDVVTNILKDSD